MRFDIVTFGSAVIDIFVDTGIAEKKNFVCYPVGGKILIKNLKFDIGGGGTNTAVAFSRLGLKTGYIGKVGEDEGGKRILDLLKKEKVIFLGKQEKGEISGYSIILDSKEKNRTILTYKGINNRIKLNDISLDKLKTDWIYYSALLGDSLKTQFKLAKKMKLKGVKLAFNPSSYLIKEKSCKKILLNLINLVDILILNKEEAEMLVRGKDPLKSLYELGPRIIVVTNKNKKIVCFDGKRKYFLKPNKVKVVERTGAGDAFAAGFVAGQVVGKSIENSLELGLKESESVIRHFGAKNKLLKLKLK